MPPQITCRARRVNRFAPRLVGLESRLALAPAAIPPVEVPPLVREMPLPWLPDPVLQETIRMQQNRMLNEMWDRDRTTLPDFPPPAPPVEEPESFWEYFHRVLGEMNDVVPNPGSLF